MTSMQFHAEKKEVSFKYARRPVFHIGKVDFQIQNKPWHDRFRKIILSVNILAFTFTDDEMMELHSQPIILGNFTSTKQHQPSVMINQTFRYTKNWMQIDLAACAKWKVVVSVSGIEFEPHECLIVEYEARNDSH